ncbi:hypothetical protein [Acetobacter phage phiAX1]|nr:hypothetical protein [Acetobacter phage phiAX1]
MERPKRTFRIGDSPDHTFEKLIKELDAAGRDDQLRSTPKLNSRKPWDFIVIFKTEAAYAKVHLKW